MCSLMFSFFRCSILRMLNLSSYRWRKKLHFTKNLTDWSRSCREVMRWKQRHWWTGRKMLWIRYKSNNRYKFHFIQHGCIPQNRIHLQILKVFFFFLRLKKATCICRDSRSWKKLTGRGRGKTSWKWEWRLSKSEFPPLKFPFLLWPLTHRKHDWVYTLLGRVKCLRTKWRTLKNCWGGGNWPWRRWRPLMTKLWRVNFPGNRTESVFNVYSCSVLIKHLMRCCLEFLKNAHLISIFISNQVSAAVKRGIHEKNREISGEWDQNQRWVCIFNLLLYFFFFFFSSALFSVI